MVIKAAGGQICSSGESKQASVVLKLVNQQGTYGPSRIQGQSTAENGGARMGGQVRGGVRRGQPQTSRNGGTHGTTQTRHGWVARQLRQPIRACQNSTLIVPWIV